MEINIKTFDIFRSNVVEWIIDMLVSDEIMLNDIPAEDWSISLNVPPEQ